MQKLDDKRNTTNSKTDQESNCCFPQGHTQMPMNFSLYLVLKLPLHRKKEHGSGARALSRGKGI